jgi:deoxyribonuclease V
VLPRLVHRWDLDRPAAKLLQEGLAPLVSHSDAVPASPRYVAGVDCSGSDEDGEALAAIVVMALPGLETVEVRTVRGRPLMPYVPGYLSFREVPLLLEGFQRLAVRPDLIICDGHGYAHPRRFGLACHLGLVLDCPAIGCAKSLLVGRYEGLSVHAGSTAAVVHRGEPIGVALRTQAGRTPVFVSVGHRVDIAAAVKWVMATTGRYRLPEPGRLAHLAASGRLKETTTTSPPSPEAIA